MLCLMYCLGVASPVLIFVLTTVFFRRSKYTALADKGICVVRTWPGVRLKNGIINLRVSLVYSYERSQVLAIRHLHKKCDSTTVELERMLIVGVRDLDYLFSSVARFTAQEEEIELKGTWVDGSFADVDIPTQLPNPRFCLPEVEEYKIAKVLAWGEVSSLVTYADGKGLCLLLDTVFPNLINSIIQEASLLGLRVIEKGKDQLLFEGNLEVVWPLLIDLASRIEAHLYYKLHGDVSVTPAVP